MGSITRITWMSGRPLKHERSYFVDRPPSQKRNGQRCCRQRRGGEGGNHRKGTPTPWRSAVVRSPQQLVQYQVVTARVLAQCRAFAVLEHVIQIGEFVPSRARPVELIAELLQRHPLHRLLHDTTVIASPRIHLPSVAEPNQIRLRILLRTPELAPNASGHRYYPGVLTHLCRWSWSEPQLTVQCTHAPSGHHRQARVGSATGSFI